eukprot:scaffold52018_cov15-Tisochrysis_lutea.AAC.1
MLRVNEWQAGALCLQGAGRRSVSFSNPTRVSGLGLLPYFIIHLGFVRFVSSRGRQALCVIQQFHASIKLKDCCQKVPAWSSAVVAGPNWTKWNALGAHIKGIGSVALGSPANKSVLCAYRHAK